MGRSRLWHFWLLGKVNPYPLTAILGGDKLPFPINFLFFKRVNGKLKDDFRFILIMRADYLNRKLLNSHVKINEILYLTIHKETFYTVRLNDRKSANIGVKPKRFTESFPIKK